MNFRRGSAAVRRQRTGGAGHTTETLCQRVRAEYKGAPNTFIIGDMPFGSYNVSPEQAIETANPAFASR